MIEKILKELQKTLPAISRKEFETVYSGIKKATHIFIAGAGRSGLIGKCFAMRLRHLGKKSFVAGETICPPIRKNDLLIVISCSGCKSSVLSIAEMAKKAGGRIISITSGEKNSLAKISDNVIFVPVHHSVQFGNSLFEQTVFLFLDTFVLFYQKKSKIPFSLMEKRHANLE